MEILKKDNRIEPFIKDIFLLDDPADVQHNLPFYADGYPGVLFSETESGVLMMPNNKLLPDFILYGQTIEPIQLQISGPYKMIVFKLYPFATRLLLGINPKDINDECYDLHQVKNIDTEQTVQDLRKADTNKRVELISDYMLQLIKNASVDEDNIIKMAVSTIVNSKGMTPIHAVRDQLFISERTFERRFKKEIGVTPKQFARIIQFSFSLNQIKETDYTKLTNIAYDNGYTDQSHFIKTFKQFTGATPREVLSSFG